MERRKSGGMVALSAIALSLSGGMVLAQGGADADGAASGSAPATLRVGTCDTPGDVAALLSDVAGLGAPEGTQGTDAWLGPEPTRLVRFSTTQIPIPLESIAESGHAIVVGDPVAGPVLACGVVGGPLIEETMLAVALLGADDRAVWGIALLGGLGLDATTVQLFIATQGEDGGPSESPDPSADHSPAPIPEGSAEPSPEPGASPDGGGGDIEPDPDDIGPDPDSDIDPGEEIDVDVGSGAEGR